MRVTPVGVIIPQRTGGHVMDFKSLFLSPNGRIGRRDFWIGFALLVVANVVLGLIPGIGQLMNLASIYFWVCISSKRFHDMGKSGWLTLVPYAVFFGSLIVAAVTGGAAAIVALAQGTEGAGGIAALSALGVASLVLLLACLFNLGFLIWQGTAAGTPGPNRYDLATTAPEAFS